MGGWGLFSVEIPEHFNAPAWPANVVPIGQGQNQNMLSPYPVEAYSLIKRLISTHPWLTTVRIKSWGQSSLTTPPIIVLKAIWPFFPYPGIIILET